MVSGQQLHEDGTIGRGETSVEDQRATSTLTSLLLCIACGSGGGLAAKDSETKKKEERKQWSCHGHGGWRHGGRGSLPSQWRRWTCLHRWSRGWWGPCKISGCTTGFGTSSHIPGLLPGEGPESESGIGLFGNLQRTWKKVEDSIVTISSTESFLAAFQRGSCISLGSRRSCSRLRRRRLIITTHHKPTYHITTSHHNSSQLITPYHIPSHHSSTSHTSLITAPLLITTHHNSTSERSTSHHNSSQLITSQIITAQLLTPLLTPHLSHPNSSQLHFSHLSSQVHFSHLSSHTSPKLYINLRYIKAWHVGLSGPFI